MTALSGAINPRQEKVLLRLFAERVDGFENGLSAEKYIGITKTSRARATRDLADLVEKGTLTKTGEVRHTRYWLKLDFPRHTKHPQQTVAKPHKKNYPQACKTSFCFA